MNDRCSENSIRLGNSSSYNLPFSSTTAYTGRVEICSNGEYVDVCDSTEEAQYFAREACNYFSSSYNATIVPYDSEYSSAASERSYTVSNCSNIEYNGVGSCNNASSNTTCAASPLSVHCEAECNSFGSTRLLQTTTTNYANGTTGVSGILQFCEYDYWRTVCENNYTDFDANRFCVQFGYSNGSFLSYNPGGDLTEGYQFVNLSCPTDYNYSPGSCSIEYGDQDDCGAEVNLYCYNAVVENTCYDGDIRLGSYDNQQTYASGSFSNGSSFSIGYFEVCINNTYHTLCNEGLDVESASLLCSRTGGYNLGYPGALYGSNSDYLLPAGSSNGIYDIYCPYDYFSTSECTFSTNGSNGCNANGGAALVTCVNIPSDSVQQTCFGPRLADGGYGSFFNGTSFNIGRPTICVNISQSAPICGPVDQEDAVLLCSDAHGQYGALTSPVFGTSYDYPMNNDANVVVSDFYCPPERFFDFYVGNCNSTVSSSSNGCSSFNPQPLITCYDAPRPCQESSVNLDYIDSSDNEDNNYVAFFSVRYCTGNAYNIICREGITDYEAEAICGTQGYDTGFVADRYSNYTSYDSTDNYLAYFSCENGSLFDCTYDIVDSCSDYEGQAVVGCYNVNPFSNCYPGEVMLLDEYYYDYNGNPGTELVTGYPALCVNNTFVPVCETAEISLIEARFGCDSATNYTFGFVGSSDLYDPLPLEYNGTVSIANVSCDLNGNCTYNYTTDGCGEYQTITCGIICNDNDTRLFDQRMTYTPEGLVRLSGIPQVCAEGGWVTVCNDGTNDPQLPTAICQEDLGLRYGRLLSREEVQGYGPNPPGTLYLNEYVCYDDNDCEGNITFDCTDNYEPYVIECYNYENCEPGDIQLAYSQSITYEGGDYVYGYPLICVDDELLPLCRNSMPGLLEVTSICYTSVNLTYGFPGTPSFVFTPAVEPFFNESAVVTDYYCNTDYDCNNLTNESDTGCLQEGGYARITCAYVCEDGDRRLYNEDYYFTDNGLLRLTGTPQICVNGGWVSICNDGTNNENLPDLICEDSGFTGGTVLAPNRTLYGASGPGTYYINNVTCYESVENCDYEDVFSDECLSGDYDYVVQCYNFSNCRPGEIQLAYSQRITYEGGDYVYGYPLICVDDELLPLCRNSMPGLLELSSICYSSLNLTYGFPGFPSFIFAPAVEPSFDVAYVVTNYDCTYGSDENECSSTTNHSDAGCIVHGGYARVTCAYVCLDGQRRLYNNRTYYTEDGLLRVTGTPQECSNGGWVSICNDGTNNENLPNIICQNSTFLGGTLLAPNRTLYGTSGPGTYYINNVTCYESVDNCQYQETYTDQCLSGDYDYVVQCYNIVSSPAIVQAPENVSVLQTPTANASFTCRFTGDPTPMVQWVYLPSPPLPAVMITPGNGFMIETPSDDELYVTSTLTISPVTLANLGAYRCMGVNGAPEPAVGMATLQVVVAPTIELTVTTESLTPTEDESFTLTCTESGAFPALSIVWNKGTDAVLQSNRITITSTTSQNQQTLLYTVQSTLSIPSVALSDSGSYTCRTGIVPIMNAPVISSAVALDVQVRNECVLEAPSNQLSPCVNGYCVDGANTYFCQCNDGFTGRNCDQQVTVTSPPMFVMQPSEESVLLGNTANFSCIATGEPQPSIMWFRDGQVLSGEVTPFLIITSVGTANRGFYSCSATNSEGSITSDEALLRIQNIAQYISVLTINTTAPARRKRQAINSPVVQQARDLAVGRVIAPGIMIVALDAYLVNEEIQLVFTVQTPVTDDGRPDTTGATDGLNAFGAEVSASMPTLSFSPVMRFDGCLPEATPLFGSVQLNWPEISAGENATLPCPCGNISDVTGLTASRMCQGDFVTISQWLNPYTTQCQYDEYSQQLCEASANDNATAGAAVLSTVTTNADSFDEDNLGIAAAFLTTLASSEDLTSTVATTLLSAVNNMVNVPSTTLSSNTDSANEILESLDSLASNVPLNDDGTAVIVQSTVAISAQEVTPENFTSQTFTVTTNSDGNLDGNALSSNGQSTASVNVPDSLLEGVPDAERISFGVLTSDAFFVQSSRNKSEVQTVILSLSVHTTDGVAVIDNLDPPVVFNFALDSPVNPVCSFWDTVSSLWSSEGCTTSLSVGNVVCECDHLSSFAVVEGTEEVTNPTEPSTTEGPEAEEEYTTEPIIIVGAVISILLIIVAVVSHLIPTTQRYSAEGKIIICSHIILIVLYLVLVLAAIASYTDSEGFCGTFSGLFHFMSLVYVMMVFVESLFYVVKLRHGVSESPFIRLLLFLLFFSVFAIPLVIVIVSVGAGHDYYALENSFCRPQDYPFYYGYIIPIIVIYLAAILCIVVGCATVLLVPMKGPESSFRKQLITPHLFAVFILSLTLLVTWIFGLVGTDNSVTGPASTATQYIFGFLMMIHAVVLLIVTMLRTEDTRKVWLNLLNRLTGRAGKYDFADETPRTKNTTDNVYEERIGLGASGQFTREGSIKKKDLGADDTTPLSTSPDGKDDGQQDDTTFSSKEEEKKVEAEEKRKREKEEEIEKLESVISNPSADVDNNHENEEQEKKTDL